MNTPMTLAHNISKLMPAAMAETLRPRWHWHREARALRRLGGTFARSPEFGDLVARRPLGPDGRMMPLVIRSYRELRRIVLFGHHEGDIVDAWLKGATDCRVLYDVGSANGQEGFFMNHLHGSQVVFIEPFTPSVESILKTIYLLGLEGRDTKAFNMVHAGCDERETYDRLYMHGLPKAGETYNSFAHPEDYCRGGRLHEPVVVSQWIKGVSLDSLHYTYKLDAPTHVKVDVDGLENRVVRGAARLLADKVVKSWMIEITGDENEAEISGAMARAGYRERARFEHYPGAQPRTFDILYEPERTV